MGSIKSFEEVAETVKRKDRKMRVLKLSGVFKMRDGVKKCDRAINEMERVIVTYKKIQVSSDKRVRNCFKSNSGMSWYKMWIEVFKVNSDFKFKLKRVCV